MLDLEEMAKLESQINELFSAAIDHQTISAEIEALFDSYGISDAQALGELLGLFRDKYWGSSSPLNAIRAMLTSKHLTIKHFIYLMAMSEQYENNTAASAALWRLAGISEQSITELYAALRVQYKDSIPAAILKILCVSHQMTLELMVKLFSEQRLLDYQIIEMVLQHTKILTSSAELGMLYHALEKQYGKYIPYRLLAVLLADKRLSAQQAIDMLVTQQDGYLLAASVFDNVNFVNDPEAPRVLYQKLIEVYGQAIPEPILYQFAISTNKLSEQELIHCVMTQTFVNERVVGAIIEHGITSAHALDELCIALEHRYQDQIPVVLLGDIFGSSYITPEQIIHLIATQRLDSIESIYWIISPMINSINNAGKLADFYQALGSRPRDVSFMEDCLCEICAANQVTAQLIDEIITAHADDVRVVVAALGNARVMADHALVQRLYAVLQHQYLNNMPKDIMLGIITSKQLSGAQMMQLIQVQSKIDAEVIRDIMYSRCLSGEQIIELIQAHAKVTDKAIVTAISNTDFTNNPFMFNRLYEAIKNKYNNGNMPKSVPLALLKHQNLIVEQVVEIATKYSWCYNEFIEDIDAFDAALIAVLRRAIGGNNIVEWLRLLDLARDNNVLPPHVIQQVIFADPRADVPAIIACVMEPMGVVPDVVLAILQNPNPEVKRQLSKMIEDNNQHTELGFQYLAPEVLSTIMQQEIRCGREQQRPVNERLVMAILNHRNTSAATRQLVLDHVHGLNSARLRMLAEKLLNVTPRQIAAAVTEQQERAAMLNRLRQAQQAAGPAQVNALAKIALERQRFNNTRNLAAAVFPSAQRRD